jgi:hypothetical protein
MTALRSSLRLAAIAALCAHGLGGCASHISAAYAIVPPQIVSTPYGTFEVVDRPDVSRLVITPLDGDYAIPLRALHYGLDFFSIDLSGYRDAASPGSAYIEPLTRYFTQTGRTCQLIRGMPLVHPRWEFVYNCTPGFDTSVITWKPPGYSNAPIPPPEPPIWNVPGGNGGAGWGPRGPLPGK